MLHKGFENIRYEILIKLKMSIFVISSCLYFEVSEAHTNHLLNTVTSLVCIV